MTRDRWLAAVSAVQLAAGVLGLVVAVRRRRAYDFLFLHGHPDAVARDAVLMGTAYSAPVPMLVAQTIATWRVARGSSTSSALVLGALGAAMVPGYAGERLVRARLTRQGFDGFESAVVIVGVGTAAAMAALGLAKGRRRAT